MNLDSKKNISVIGSGIMGSGIAQVCAQSGFNVLLYDANQEGLTKAYPKILTNIEKWCVKNNKTDEIDSIKANLSIATSLEDLRNSDIIIEAITERLEAKQALFEQLENIVSSNTILASNTSGILISKIARGASHPDRIIGTHFFNPPPLMPLVEVVQGEQTSEEVLINTVSFIERLNKTVIKAQDVSGFVVNRITTPMLTEAMLTLEAGIASKEDIDQAIKLSMKHPIGPLELSDYIGLDTILMFMEGVYKETSKEGFKPPQILRKLVSEGKFGVKSGEGFYNYSKSKVNS
jgi:3-hydroxybutyryl-CoA dehydrogenase